MLQQSLQWMYRPNQQEINKYEFFALLKQALGREPGRGDEKWFDGCGTVEQFMHRMLDTEVFQALALRNNHIGRANLVEFYVCLRAALTWEPNPGFDLYGALKYQDDIKAGKIEVKHGGEIQSHSWNIQATGKEKVIKADVLVFIGMPEAFNPCEGTMFVIPSSAYRETVVEQLEIRDRIPEIHINTSRYNGKTKKLNKWYEYELIDHTLLKEQLGRYIHGVPVVLSQQLVLF